MKLRVLDLFSGIGGFSLGLERTGGFETVAFCEIEEYPRQVLAKHWPGVPIYHDVRELTADTLRRDGIAVDVICGGFPCQDISHAGKRAGLEGARSGLWTEYARIIAELRPRFVIIENVPGLLTGGDEVELPPDQCICGWSTGWGGLHHDSRAQRSSALRPRGHRDVGKGASGAAEAPAGVWRDDHRDAPAVGAVGGSTCLEAIRPPAGSVPAGRHAVPYIEATPGRARIVDADADRWTAAEAEWFSFLDGSGHPRRQGNSRAGAGGKSQGASHHEGGGVDCPSCGRRLADSAGQSVVATWLGRVLWDLAAIGMHAVWDCVPASAIGAPHRRDRVWIVAHAYRGRSHAEPQRVGGSGDPIHAGGNGEVWPMADADRGRGTAREQASERMGHRRAVGPGGCDVANSECLGQQTERDGGIHGEALGTREADRIGGGGEVCDADVSGLAIGQGECCDDGTELAPALGADWWLTEPDVGRVAHGVPSRVDRLKGLGNAVVPQIPEMIGRAILAAVPKSKTKRTKPDTSEIHTVKEIK